MDEAGDRGPLLGEITCGSLLQKLQEIWDEVGEGVDEEWTVTKKATGTCSNEGANGTPSRRLSLHNSTRSASKDGEREGSLSAPVNYVALSKEEAACHVSRTDPIPASP